MLCSHPYLRTPNGVSRKHVLLSDEARAAATPFGCGRCLACRINKARVWSHRLMLEQRLHDSSCFVTLTYNDDNLPEGGRLDKHEVQKFLKRLRRRKEPEKVRYFCVGEYGEETYRPHYHLALFGIGSGEVGNIESAWDYKANPVANGYRSNRSKRIEAGDRVRGNVTATELEKESARYIAGYVLKNMKEKEYKPWTLSSSRPGIGGSAIDFIGYQLKKNRRTVPLRVLRYGKEKDIVLGRYLEGRLKEILGNEGEYRLESYKYQDELFEAFMYEDEKGYGQRLLDAFAHDRHVQEKKDKIFGQRRKGI